MQMRGILTAVLICLCGRGAIAQVDSPKLEFGRPHGQIFSNVYPRVPGLGPDHDLLQQTTGVLLDLNPQFGDRHALNVNLLGLHYTAKAQGDMPTSELLFREGYYQYRRGGWDLRVGRQIMSWGKADVISPTDFLVATDYRRFTPLNETRRIGGDGASLSYIPNGGDSPWNLTAVWNWNFARSTLLLPPTSPGLHVDLQEPETPAVKFENSEVALKASYIQNAWDASLSFFNGWNHLPELTKGRVYGLNPDVTVKPKFSRIRALGFDASRGFDEWVWRVEGAYTWTENDRAQTAAYQPSHADLVMGLERPVGQKWRVQVQGSARYFPRYRDPLSETGVGLVDAEVNRALARANALVQGYERSWKAGATLRIAYGGFEDKLNPEIFLLSYPATQELLLRPRMLYRLADAWQVDVGMERYFGPQNSVIGRFQPYSAYFAELRWLF